MRTLSSYLEGRWAPEEVSEHAGVLVNPCTEEPVARLSSAAHDFGSAMHFARSKGGAALRDMTFAQRADMLSKMSEAIHQHREELIDLAQINGGNTRGDAKFDIDGATATLSYYARQGAKLGEQHLLEDGDILNLSRSRRYVGRHLYCPRRGVAVLINAFNFPAWGFAEKAAAALLAGVPVLTKPASSTALVAHRIIEILVNARCVPEGALSLISGGVGYLFEHLHWQDVIAFTGSSSTARKIAGHPQVIARHVRVNVEADSLNAAVLGADLTRDSEAYELFLREAGRDLTQKAGQKCTAMRRILVPQDLLNAVREDLVEELKQHRVGDPALREVRVGPLATEQQRRSVEEGIALLSKETRCLLGGKRPGILQGIDHERGYFIAPTLFETALGDTQSAVHDVEIFGPVGTLIAYGGKATDAASILARGQGALVSSVYSDDQDFHRQMVWEAGAYVGRLHLASTKVAEHSTGPGTVLPMLLHGGPGRAGGGEELGGMRALALYMQRLAVQGFSPTIEKLA
jgi:3,4-dehydroadipyl-CoA semialdehyde dehydrogenase